MCLDLEELESLTRFATEPSCGGMLSKHAEVEQRIKAILQASPVEWRGLLIKNITRLSEYKAYLPLKNG